MRVLVTGSSGHLGEALVRTLRRLNHEVVSIDLLESPFATCTGSITERGLVQSCLPGVQVVFHAARMNPCGARNGWE
jgi:UDP-glucose 4-epimerase